MSSDSYFYLNEKAEACGPYTAAQMRSMVAAGKLTSETLAAVPDTPDWVPLGTLIPSLPGKPSRPGKHMRVSTVVILLLGVIALGALGYAAMRWAPALKKINAAKEEPPAPQPHALARWYLFGYFHGRQQAKMNAVFGKKTEATRADLAYALKALGVPDPPPQHFAICTEGYEDGMQNKPQRHVLEKDLAQDDAFPAALEGIFELPVQEKPKSKPTPKQAKK